MKHFVRLLWVSVLLLGLSACQRSGPAPIENAQSWGQQPQGVLYYAVKRGDTLYSIARRHQVSVSQLAQWNRLKPPYLLLPGQRLSLIASGRAASGATYSTSSAPRASNPPKIRRHAGSGSCRPYPDWRWPVRGEVKTVTSPTGNPGVKIFGRSGEVIRAAAPGKVVYSGPGLNGYYGNLIIIQHPSGYLSVYAHVANRLVGENAQLRGGQKIATMGLGSDKRAVLHFELRCQERSLNPLLFLPGY